MHVSQPLLSLYKLYKLLLLISKTKNYSIVPCSVCFVILIILVCEYRESPLMSSYTFCSVLLVDVRDIRQHFKHLFKRKINLIICLL